MTVLYRSLSPATAAPLIGHQIEVWSILWPEPVTGMLLGVDFAGGIIVNLGMHHRVIAADAIRCINVVDED